MNDFNIEYDSLLDTYTQTQYINVAQYSHVDQYTTIFTYIYQQVKIFTNMFTNICIHVFSCLPKGFPGDEPTGSQLSALCAADLQVELSSWELKVKATAIDLSIDTGYIRTTVAAVAYYDNMQLYYVIILDAHTNKYQPVSGVSIVISCHSKLFECNEVFWEAGVERRMSNESDLILQEHGQFLRGQVPNRSDLDSHLAVLNGSL